MTSPSSPQATLERVAQRRAGRDDRVAFARLCGIEPDPWQVPVLRSEAQMMALNIHRQGGKSTTCAVLANHRAIYAPNQTVIIAAPTEEQAKETLRRASQQLARLEVRPKMEADSRTVIELSNGSRIIALTASESKRGYTCDLLIEDECGDVDDEIHATVLLPWLIVSRGRLILAGTPKGRRGHYFRYWHDSAIAMERHTATWRDCPRLSADAIDMARRSLGPKFGQEYEGAFIDAGAGLVYRGFDSIRCVIDALPEHGHPGQQWIYWLGMDFGHKRSRTAFAVIATRAMDPCVYVVSTSKHSGWLPDDIRKHVTELDGRFKFQRMIGDIGNLGVGWVEELRRRPPHLPIEAAQKHNKYGYIELMNGDYEAGRLKVVRGANADYVEEMITLAWNRDRSREHETPQEQEGQANDICDAALYIWRAVSTVVEEAPVPPVVPTQGEQIRQMTDRWREKYEEHAQQRVYEQSEAWGGFEGDGEGWGAWDGR